MTKLSRASIFNPVPDQKAEYNFKARNTELTNIFQLTDQTQKEQRLQVFINEEKAFIQASIGSTVRTQLLDAANRALMGMSQTIPPFTL